MAYEFRWTTEKEKLREKGQICHDCGVWFKKPHGKPVICLSCAKWRLYGKRKIDLPIAVHPEIWIDDLSPAERLSILGKQGEERYRAKLRKQRKNKGGNYGMTLKKKKSGDLV